MDDNIAQNVDEDGQDMMEDDEELGRLALLQQRHEDGPVRFGEIRVTSAASALEAGLQAGNILLGSREAEIIVSDAGREARERQDKLIKIFEEKRRMGQVVVPTDHAQVRAALRRLGEPITLFGEREGERRDRLKACLAQLSDAQVAELTGQSDLLEALTSTTGVVQTELFYTEGPATVRDRRAWIAQYSLGRAKARVARERREREEVSWPEEQLRRQSVSEAAARFTNESSEVADDRPVASCCFTPDGATLITAGWTGTVKLWTVPNLQKTLTVRAHEERITGLAVNPAAASTAASASPLFATASADRTARLWSSDGTLLATLGSHEDRLGRVAFHPSGRFLATASFDQTWRLWDLETAAAVVSQGGDAMSDSAAFSGPPPAARPQTEACLYEQEGHSRAVYAVAFQGDGSLLASGGLDAIGRVWDLRTGRSVVTLEGHVKPILALDFSPDGYHLVTGSEDNSCQFWDLRKASCLMTIPAHRSLVSHVRFRPGTGDYFVTAGYDNTAKVWSSHDFKLLRILQGHENKVMGCDVLAGGAPGRAGKGDLVATVSYDRTVKFFAESML